MAGGSEWRMSTWGGYSGIVRAGMERDGLRDNDHASIPRFGILDSGRLAILSVSF